MDSEKLGFPSKGKPKDVGRDRGFGCFWLLRPGPLHSCLKGKGAKRKPFCCLLAGLCLEPFEHLWCTTLLHGLGWLIWDLFLNSDGCLKIGIWTLKMGGFGDFPFHVASATNPRKGTEPQTTQPHCRFQGSPIRPRMKTKLPQRAPKQIGQLPDGFPKKPNPRKGTSSKKNPTRT